MVIDFEFLEIQGNFIDLFLEGFYIDLNRNFVNFLLRGEGKSGIKANARFVAENIFLTGNIFLKNNVVSNFPRNFL